MQDSYCKNNTRLRSLVGGRNLILQDEDNNLLAVALVSDNYRFDQVTVNILAFAEGPPRYWIFHAIKEHLECNGEVRTIKLEVNDE